MKKIESLQYQNAVNLKRLEEYIKLEDEWLTLKEESKEKEDTLKKNLSNMTKKHDGLLVEANTAMETLKKYKKENYNLKKELTVKKKFVLQMQQILQEYCLKLCLIV